MARWSVVTPGGELLITGNWPRATEQYASMPILIDGHNLIGQMKSIRLADPDDEERLIERLAAWQRRRRTQVTVVFDAGAHAAPRTAPEQRAGGVRVVYARPGQRADDLICSIVRRSADRRGWLVVSSDRALQVQVRHLGASVIPAHEFARELDAPPAQPSPQEKEQPPSPSEVEEWLRIFSERRKRSPRGR